MMKEKATRKVFFEVDLFTYFTEKDITVRKPIAFFVVETSDPDTKIIPVAANPQGTWTIMEARVSTKNQRGLYTPNSLSKGEN